MALKRIGVLLVDDHPLIHAGVEWALRDKKDLRLVGACFSCAEAIAIVEQTEPDIVIIDLRLPDGEGLDLVRRLVDRTPPIPTLVFSSMDEDLYAERVLRAGAKGFLQKNGAIELLIAAIRTIAKGKIFLSETMHQKMASIIGRSGARDPLDSLSNRELQVFELIGQGKSTRQIAEHLGRSVKTIETYRDRLRKKLGLDSGTELTHVAIQRASQST